jgi:hypothetical protein
VSDERTELDRAIDALRDDVEVPLDGGAATEAAVLRAIRLPPPWWKTWWWKGVGGVGLLAIAVGVAVLTSRRDESPVGAHDPASHGVSSATDDRATESSPTEGTPIESASTEGAPIESAPTEGASIEGASTEGASTEGAPTERAPSDEVAPSSTPRRRERALRASAPDVLPTTPATTSEPEAPPLATPASSTAVEAPTTLVGAMEASPSFDEQRTRFRDAHRLQYTAPPAVALETWDRFLRDVPTGPFADEARYYRALTLGRLGRLDEARETLRAIAAGRHGERHRADAVRVLRQLSR